MNKIENRSISMNFGLSFSFIFQDGEWFKKLVLAGLCMLIPFIGWMVVLGWALRIAQNVINGEKNPLPELKFGDDLLKGFFVFLIGFVYSLPVQILSTLSGWLGRWHFFDVEYGNLVSVILGGGLGLLAFLIGLLTSLLSLAAIANYAAKENLGAAFRLGEVFELLKTNLGGWIVAALGALLALGIIGPLGTLACIIGVVLTLTYGFGVVGHLTGQAYLKSQDNQPI
jgi:hypothetical protein